MCETPHTEIQPSDELLKAVAADVERIESERTLEAQIEANERFLCRVLYGTAQMAA